MPTTSNDQLLSKNEAVLGMPKLGKVVNTVCVLCQLGKQSKAQHHDTLTTATTKAFELFHIDHMGPTQTKSLGGKKYIMVVVDDFTRFIWVILLRSKSEAPQHIETLCKRLQIEKG